MIEIVKYQPGWPAEFKEIAAELRLALGELALRIDHIGSTSVPGLAAKDRIDIQVTVSALTPAVQMALEAIGYNRSTKISADHLPPGCIDESQWRKWFFSAPKERRPMNLHVRVAGYPNQRYPLLFRDYLRTHPDAAEAYARIKKALAQYRADDIDAYYEIKDPVCDLIAQAAEAWAERSGWQPGPSDA
jgi:GrpB-like predicted nucleotidyltransferase (UPF0157 family)